MSKHTANRFIYGELIKAVGEVNAAFIVRACNAHDKLVEALKAAQMFASLAKTNWKDQAGMAHALETEIKAAIAAAESK